MGETFSSKLGHAVAQHGRLQFIDFGLTGRGVINHASNPGEEGQWLGSASALLRLSALGFTSFNVEQTDPFTRIVLDWIATHCPPDTIDISWQEVRGRFSEEAWRNYSSEDIRELSAALLAASDAYLRKEAVRPGSQVPDADAWQKFVDHFDLSDRALPRDFSAEDRVRLCFLAAGAKARTIAFDDERSQSTELIRETLQAI